MARIRVILMCIAVYGLLSITNTLTISTGILGGILVGLLNGLFDGFLGTKNE